MMSWHRILGRQLWTWEGAQSFAEENLTSAHRPWPPWGGKGLLGGLHLKNGIA